MKIFIFFATFLVYHLIGSNFFPVDENNVLQVPDWYPILGIFLSAVVTYLFSQYKKNRIFKNLTNTFENQTLQLGSTNQLVISRKKQIAGSAATHTVFLDGKLVGTIKNGKKIIIDTYPGNHNILVKGIWNQADSISFVVLDNQKTIYVFDELNLWKSNIKLSLIKDAFNEVEKSSITVPKEKIDISKYWIKGNIDLLETDLVETCNIEVCCEKCARYRNRIFSLTGQDKRFPKIPKDFNSACCGIALWPFVWGVSEPGFICNDPIAYSNRPFVDDRTDDEKERYEKSWHGKTKSIQPSTSTKPSASTPVRVKDRNPMDIIHLMEKRFEEQYQFAYTHLLNLQDCQKMYAQTEKEFESIELPLMAQVRFEQLCAEYKEKFNITNPFVVIDAMDGYTFEQWCAELLRKNGYTDVEVTPGSGDQGVDVIAAKDGIRYAIQCKCYSSDLGNTPVQEVNAGKAMYHCQIGVVMTNRHFTAGAKECAKANGVLLWDREKIKDMIENQEM